ncbi:MAG: PilZ domain-containing protein [Candidatus Omnitrophica bacterium]|nr:PilZ domain-containing protein [Candidatus Omnitrophota bacterium]
MPYSPQLYRRQYKRYEVDGQADLLVDNVLERPSILKDLSVRGAGIISDCPLSPGSEIGILMCAPLLFKGQLQRRARVVWCNEIGNDLWRVGLDLDQENIISFER